MKFMRSSAAGSDAALSCSQVDYLTFALQLEYLEGCVLGSAPLCLSLPAGCSKLTRSAAAASSTPAQPSAGHWTTACAVADPPALAASRPLLTGQDRCRWLLELVLLLRSAA